MDLASTPEIQILARVAIAACFGLLVGLERELVHKPTGMRTHMFICMSTCLITCIGVHMDTVLFPQVLGEMTKADPARIIQALVIGVGFIGAGTIMQIPGEERVVYLTSAASILLTAGIGIATGISLYVVGLGCVIYVWIINRVIRYIDKAFLSKRKTEGYNLENS